MKKIIRYLMLSGCLIAPASNAMVINLTVSNDNIRVTPNTSLNANLVFDTITDSVTGRVHINNADPTKFGSTMVDFAASSIYSINVDPGGMYYSCCTEGGSPVNGGATIVIGLTPLDGNNLLPKPYVEFRWTAMQPVLPENAPHSGFQVGAINSFEMLAAHYGADDGIPNITLKTNYDDSSSPQFPTHYSLSSTQASMQISQVPLPPSGLLFLLSIAGFLVKLRLKLTKTVRSS
jgi:hypothetical protein